MSTRNGSTSRITKPGFPADVDVGGGTSDVPAEVDIEGLEPNTLYHVRNSSRTGKKAEAPGSPKT